MIGIGISDFSPDIWVMHGSARFDPFCFGHFHSTRLGILWTRMTERSNSGDMDMGAFSRHIFISFVFFSHDFLMNMFTYRL